IANFGYYPYYNGTIPSIGTNSVVGYSSNTASGNFNGVSTDDLRCAAMYKAVSNSLVMRYTPLYDMLFMSSGFSPSAFSIYLPNAVVEMTNININFPFKVYGLDMKFKGQTTISGDFTARQSRIHFENDTSID